MKRMLFGLMATALMFSAGQENEAAGGSQDTDAAPSTSTTVETSTTTETAGTDADSDDSDESDAE